MAGDRRERLCFWLVVAGASFIALVGARPYAGGWNDGSRLATVESLVDQRTLVIDKSIFLTSVPYPANEPSLEHGTLDKLFIDGHWYSDKSPVPALLLALIYQILQWTTGLVAAQSAGAFCYIMNFVGAGVPFVIAVLCIWKLGRIVTPVGDAQLPISVRVLLTASFAFATLAVVYSRHVNSHIQFLAVAALLMLQLARLPHEPITWRSAVWIGTLAGAAYTLDLGAGPPLVLCLLALLAWHGLRGQHKSWKRGPVHCQLCELGWHRHSCLCRTDRNVCATGSLKIDAALGPALLFLAAAFPWFLLHHSVNFVVGGTFAPANAIPAYVLWEGSPFQNMTGRWSHPSIASFAIYFLALLFGKHGFVLHNLPLLLALPSCFVLWKLRVREWPVIVFSIAACAGIWLVYAVSSTNYSGGSCSIRWFVPFLAPGYYILAVAIKHRPDLARDLAVLSAWGFVLMAIAWRTGPWTVRMVPGYWPIVGAALASWAIDRKLRSGSSMAVRAAELRRAA